MNTENTEQLQQLELLNTDKTTYIYQQYCKWQKTDGYKIIIEYIYNLCDKYYLDYITFNIKISQWLIIGLARHYTLKTRAHNKIQGLAINNTFIPYIIRSIIEKYPQYKEMFELREIGKTSQKKKTVVIPNAIVIKK